MSDEIILRIGADVSGLVAAASQAGSSLDSLKAKFGEIAVQAEASGQTIMAQAARFQASGMSGAEAASALVNLNVGQKEAAEAAAAVASAAGVEAPALEAVAAAATQAGTATANFGARNAMVRTELGALSGSTYMAEFGLARLGAMSETLGPILMAAFPAFAAIALGEIAVELGQKLYTLYENVVLDKEEMEALNKIEQDLTITTARLAQETEAAYIAFLKDVDPIEAAREKLRSVSEERFSFKIDDKELKAMPDVVTEAGQHYLQFMTSLTDFPASQIDQKMHDVATVIGLVQKRLAAPVLRGPLDREELAKELEMLQKISGAMEQFQALTMNRQRDAGADVGKAQDDATKKAQEAAEKLSGEQEHQLTMAYEMARIWESSGKATEEAALRAKELGTEEQAMFAESANQQSGKASEKAYAMAAAQDKYAEVANKGNEEIAVNAIQFKETEASETLKIQEGIIAASGAGAIKKARMLADAETGELNQLKAIEAQKLAVVVQGLQAQQAGLGSDVGQMAAGKKVAENPGDQEKLTQWQELQNQIDLITQQSTDKQKELALQVVQANQQAANAIQQAFEKTAMSVERSFQSNFDSVVRGTETVKFAFIKMGGDIILDAAHWAEQEIAKFAAKEATKLAMHIAGEQAQTTATAGGVAQREGLELGAFVRHLARDAEEIIIHVAKETAKTVATVAGVIEREAIEIEAHLATASRDASEAAMGAYAATVAVPIVGPFLAPAAAATAFAGVMAFASVSEKGGIMERDGPVFAHANETILPAHISATLQNALPSLAGVHEAMQSGSGSFGSGSSRSSRSSGTTNHFHISANDAKSFSDMVGRNKGEFSNMVRSAVRNRTRV